MNENLETGIDIRRILLLLKEKWWVIAAFVFLALAIAAFDAYYLEPDIYQANTLMFAYREMSLEAGQTSVSELTAYSYLIQDLKELATSDLVIAETNRRIAAAGITSERLARSRTTVKETTNTRMLRIYTQGYSPEFVKLAADTLSEVLLETAASFLPIDKIRIIDYAKKPGSQSSPNRPLILIVGFCIGVFGGVGSVLLRTALDHKVKGPDDFTARCDIPILALIPDFEETNSLLEKTSRGKGERWKKPRAHVKGGRL